MFQTTASSTLQFQNPSDYDICLWILSDVITNVDDMFQHAAASCSEAPTPALCHCSHIYMELYSLQSARSFETCNPRTISSPQQKEAGHGTGSTVASRSYNGQHQ